MRVNELRKCLTPEAQYHLDLNPNELIASVSFPAKLSITEIEATKLEDEIHDALEAILAPYWNRL